MRRHKDFLPHIAWGIALAGMLGSLYFSEIREFAPCVLCWYQRIFLYPLVFIIPIGIFDRDERIYKYVLSLSLVGLAIAVYHNLLYYGILPESVSPCRAGVSCLTKNATYFGFISIPFMSMLAFIGITVLMFLHREFNKKQ